MIIFFLIAIIYILKNDVKTFMQKDTFKVLTIFFLYSCFMIYYITYINAHSFTVGYGIPGADMLAHYSGAKFMSQGASWADLSIVANRFESIGISSIGYFIYTTFVYITCFWGNIIPSGFCIYMLYLFQIFLSIDTCVKFSKTFAFENKKIKPMQYICVLVFCIPYAVQACQLMRDIYFMWFMSILLETTVSYKCENSTNSQKRVIFFVKIISLFLICILLRSYSILIALPLFLYYYDKKKLATIVAVVEFGVVTIGTGFLILIREYLGVFWNIVKPDLIESMSFLLFPSIINQTKYILNWKYYFGDFLDAGGCNVPGVYFIMSVWNTIMIPFALVDLPLNWKKSKEKIVTHTLILLTVVVLYSVTYSTIDTRHKLFMSIPITCLGVEGYFDCCEKIRGFNIVIPFVFLVCFVFIILMSI